MKLVKRRQPKEFSPLEALLFHPFTKLEKKFFRKLHNSDLNPFGLLPPRLASNSTELRLENTFRGKSAKKSKIENFHERESIFAGRDVRRK